MQPGYTHARKCNNQDLYKACRPGHPRAWLIALLDWNGYDDFELPVVAWVRGEPMYARRRRW